MAEEVPTITIDVDVTGTEKIEEVAEATKKVDKAQKDLAKRNKKLGKAFKLLSGTLGKVDSGIGSLIGNFGKLAFAAAPMFAAVSMAGIAINAVTDALAKNREAVAFQRAKFTEITETAAAARAEFETLTATILENGEIMRKYGIQFDGTIASMVANISTLKSAKFAANVAKNDAFLQTESDAYMLGGFDMLDARHNEMNQTQIQSKAFEKALSSLQLDYGAKFNPFGANIPLVTAAIDSGAQFLGLKTEEQIKKGNVFREAGYREGESMEEYRDRKIREIETRIQENREQMASMESLGMDTSGVEEQNRNLLEILRNGPRNANRRFSDSETQAVMTMMSYFHNIEKANAVGKGEQIDETKKKIEQAKKADAILNPKKTDKTKKVPDGVWDSNSMGAIPYATTTQDAKKTTNINISNTIDVSGLDPNNIDILGDVVAKHILASLRTSAIPNGSLF